ncbi:hypothetical protein [Massilia sp. Dwa41.01b]|nr:hypothetical protein [Massilia sp. Dwa41.01b]
MSSVRLSGSGSVVLQVEGVGAVDPAAITGFNGKAAELASN